MVVLTLILGYKFITINDVHIEGLERQNEEVVENALFEANKDRGLFRLVFEMMTGKKKHIPFIEDYDIEIKSLNSVKITVYEKSITGYLICMERNWYFDKDGIVVECTSEIFEGVPYISGLDFDYVVVDEKIPLEDKEVFKKLLDLTQLISKYQMNVSQINLADGDIRLHIGNVRIELGNGERLNDKMIDLNDMLPTMEDIPGVLNMQEYDESRKGYIFKKDEEQ